MVSELVDIWRSNITKDTIYKSWGWGKLGILEGFYNKRGLYDNTPLVEFLTNYMQDHDVKRKFTIGGS